MGYDVALGKAKKEAKDKIIDSIRDLLTLKISLPLGNPSLKLLHTNQFCWTDMPSTFKLANFKILSKYLNSEYSRYSGYEVDRWYIESVTINNDGSKFTMDIDLNPFASTLNQFSEDMKSFKKAYEDATKKTTSKSKSTSTKNVASTGLQLKGGQGKVIDELTRKAVGNAKTKLQAAKNIHYYLKQYIRYSGYECFNYSTPEQCWYNHTHLNCGDTARLTCACMLSAGLDAYVCHRNYNGGHFWTVITIDGKKYASDLTGESGALSTHEWDYVWTRSSGTIKAHDGVAGGDYFMNKGARGYC